MTAMTSVRGMGPLPALVEEREGTRTLQRLFDEIDLPLSIISEANHRLPLADLIDLFEYAARRTGDPLFGLTVGTTMGGKFGKWVDYARSAPTLGGHLERASRTLRYHQSGTRLALTVRGDVAKYAYHIPVRPAHGARQHLEHTIPALLSSFRHYCGESWKPLRIEVGYGGDARLSAVEEALGIPITANRGALAIVFPAADLARALLDRSSCHSLVTLHDLRAMIRQRPPSDVAGIVADIAGTRLLEGLTDIEGVAGRMGLAVRTLQRRLHEQGCTYRDILAQTRLDRARHLLAETEQPVTDIALCLGYEEPAHFTRAFRRATDMAPRTYRRMTVRV
ncbi:AraC family transcriptional regulator ligand-binding domain-containing protein [Microbaculum sp. FT89]|uniref:helix-turn-helix transcriptional regulator n=1 Tax=Microbaculum sp. FT89 TaxID=3447298 RepID=UPI003F539619